MALKWCYNLSIRIRPLIVTSSNLYFCFLNIYGNCCCCQWRQSLCHKHHWTARIKRALSSGHDKWILRTVCFFVFFFTLLSVICLFVCLFVPMCVCARGVSICCTRARRNENGRRSNQRGNIYKRLHTHTHTRHFKWVETPRDKNITIFLAYCQYLILLSYYPFSQIWLYEYSCVVVCACCILRFWNESNQHSMH